MTVPIFPIFPLFFLFSSYFSFISIFHFSLPYFSPSLFFLSKSFKFRQKPTWVGLTLPTGAMDLEEQVNSPTDDLRFSDHHLSCRHPSYPDLPRLFARWTVPGEASLFRRTPKTGKPEQNPARHQILHREVYCLEFNSCIDRLQRRPSLPV